MHIIYDGKLGVKLILTTDFTDFYRFSQILWIELPAKEREDTENTGVSGSIVYLATAACKTGFCRGALPSATGPRMLARLGKLPKTTGGEREG